MKKRSFLILSGLLALIVLGGLGWYLGSPLFINQTVDEGFPVEIPSEEEMEMMPESEVQVLATEAQAAAAAMPVKEMEETMPPDPALVVLKAGEIVGADAFHTGSGAAMIFELLDGSRVVRLENLDVINGPDLHLLLATGANPTGSEDLGEYTDLGPLKGNIGNQNYDIPPNLDPAVYNSVVIYCVPFHVVFAHAELSS